MPFKTLVISGPMYNLDPTILSSFGLTVIGWLTAPIV